MRPWRLTIPAGLYADLQQHLFPGDGDEHDAVVPSWLPRTIAHRLKSRKVRMAARNIHRANCDARIEAVPRDFLDADVAARFTDCDFLFLAAPSVVTMNAIACAHAADDFLFHLTGLKYDDAEAGWFRWNSRRAVAGYDMPTRGSDCAECSGKEHSRFGMGDNGVLPTSQHCGLPATRPSACRLRACRDRQELDGQRAGPSGFHRLGSRRSIRRELP